MEEITRKRPGRPRKALADAVSGAEAGTDASDDAGDGQVSDAGPAAPADAGGPGEKLDWPGLAAHIRALHGPEHQIATVWHPQAYGDVLDTQLGNVRVLTGAHAYQLATGEIIEI